MDVGEKKEICCSWDLVPHNKQELVAMYREKTVVPHPNGRHVWEKESLQCRTSSISTI